MALLLLEKLKKDINILFGYVRCLMAKSDENCPLVATEWSSNHNNAGGNPYTVGTYVFWNGHVYKCLIDNNSIPPNNTTYWLDLGEGHLLAEEQSDWNATGGRQYILNKPTNTSDFFNDGEDGSSPYATMNDVNAAIASPQDIDSVLGEGDTAPDKDINVQSIGLWDNFAAPFGFARIEADKSRINFISKLGVTMGHISQGALNLIQGAFSFTINLSTLTSNRVATFQNKSGVVAYLSDITLAGGLVATAWSPNHTTATGNPYTIGTRVWYLGDVYEAILNNDSILPTNTSYWINLGPGNLLDQEPVTGFVPYTGATQDVDLGSNNLTADHIALNVSPSGAGFVVGATQWNNTIGSSETLLKGGNVTLKNGVDLVARIVNKVTPNTTLTKAAYQVVRVSGASGQKLAVNLAQANDDLNSADTLGLVTETIATNQEGFIITVGQIESINTTGSLQGETWADGDVLYLSPTTAGAITNIKPTGSTGHIVVLGYVEYAHASQGKIYVKVMNGWELDELHNVFIDTPLDKQLLAYETATQLWKNKSVSTLGIETKSTSAYSIKVNNTNATADATETTYRNKGIATYTSGIVFTATTSPSGTTNHSYNWIQIGNLVTLNINLLFSTTGGSVQNVSMTLPTDCPTPLIQTGMPTSALTKHYIGSGRMTSGVSSQSTNPSPECNLRKNAANTGFEIYLQQTAGSFSLFQVTIQYFT